MRSTLVLRKIRNGKVKVYGNWYVPDDTYLKYDGRLDGLWYWFGVFIHNDGMVSLWGSDDYKRGKVGFGKGLECVDGYFVWSFWNKIKGE